MRNFGIILLVTKQLIWVFNITFYLFSWKWFKFNLINCRILSILHTKSFLLTYWVCFFLILKKLLSILASLYFNIYFSLIRLFLSIFCSVEIIIIYNLNLFNILVHLLNNTFHLNFLNRNNLFLFTIHHWLIL